MIFFYEFCYVRQLLVCVCFSRYFFGKLLVTVVNCYGLFYVRPLLVCVCFSRYFFGKLLVTTVFFYDFFYVRQLLVCVCFLAVHWSLWYLCTNPVMFGSCWSVCVLAVIFWGNSWSLW